MAYELVAEVLDHSPVGITPGEKLVMIAVAEYVRSSDYSQGIRSTSRPAADIARRAEMTPGGLKKALQRLAERKLELRVPLFKGKDGRPVYAVPGQSSTYEIPALAAVNGGSCVCESCVSGVSTLKVVPKGVPEGPLGDEQNDDKGGPQGRLGGTTGPPGGTTGPPGGTTVPPKSVRGSGSSVARARASRRSTLPVATAEDIETIIEEIKDHGGVSTVDRDHADRVWREILGRAATRPHNPLRYVCAAIRAEPYKHVPTPIPPAYKPIGRQLPLVMPVDSGAPDAALQQRSETA